MQLLALVKFISRPKGDLFGPWMKINIYIWTRQRLLRFLDNNNCLPKFQHRGMKHIKIEAGFFFQIDYGAICAFSKTKT